MYCLAVYIAVVIDTQIAAIVLKKASGIRL